MTQPMQPVTNVVVTGTTEADPEQHYAFIEAALVRAVRAISEPAPWPIRVVQGGAEGVDLIANRIAAHRGWFRETVPAKWKECGEGCPPSSHRRVRPSGYEYCPVAGHRRNGEMLRLFPPTIVLAMPALIIGSTQSPRDQSRGTWNCIEQAALKGYRIMMEPLWVPKGRAPGQPALFNSVPISTPQVAA